MLATCTHGCACTTTCVHVTCEFRYVSVRARPRRCACACARARVRACMNLPISQNKSLPTAATAVASSPRYACLCVPKARNTACPHGSHQSLDGPIRPHSLSSSIPSQGALPDGEGCQRRILACTHCACTTPQPHADGFRVDSQRGNSAPRGRGTTGLCWLGLSWCLPRGTGARANLSAKVQWTGKSGRIV